MKNIVVTGGAGFIGCNFVRKLLTQTKDQIIAADKLTYAGSPHNLAGLLGQDRYQFIQMDISDGNAAEELFEKFNPDALVNFAAETHVDRSIDRPAEFIQTNIVGTFVLLETALKYYRKLPEEKKSGFRFLHVSTDEVYGTLGKTGLFSEETPYRPNSPYAASKASADHFVRAYFETYGLPAMITNCSNNFGPFQFPEKLIPLMLLNAIEGKELPIYGDGKNVRDWLYVEDHCEGIELVLREGAVGEKYNIGAGNERSNIELVDTLCEVLEKKLPAAENKNLAGKKIGSYKDLKKFVQDRPGHDRRYAIDSRKIRKQLGWKPRHDFKEALELTVQWYLDHNDWCEKIQSDNYSRERLGLI